MPAGALPCVRQTCWRRGGPDHREQNILACGSSCDIAQIAAGAAAGCDPLIFSFSRQRH